jgi:HEAT repeat protein
MKHVVAIIVSGFLTGATRADEPDDLLTRQLAAIIRDPRLTIDVRVDAAKSLAQLGPKAAIALDELTKQLSLVRGREQESLQEAVIEAIGAIGPTAKSALPSLSRIAGRSTDLDLALKGARSRLLEDTATVEVQSLVLQLGSKADGKRLAAAKGLGKLGGQAANALPQLTKSLVDPDADVRRASAAAIRLIAPSAKPSKELIQSFVVDLADSDDTVRLVAVRTLGKFGPAAVEATAAIQNLLSDSDRDVRKAAADALVKMAGP